VNSGLIVTTGSPRVQLVSSFVILLENLEPLTILSMIVSAAARRLFTLGPNTFDSCIERCSDRFVVNQVLIKCLIEKLTIFIHDFI